MICKNEISKGVQGCLPHPPLQKKRKDELKVVSSLSFSKGHGGEERTKSGTQKRVHKHAVVRACNLATCVTCSSQEGGLWGRLQHRPGAKNRINEGKLYLYPNEQYDEERLERKNINLE